MDEMNFQYPELIIKEEVDEEELMSSEVKESDNHQSDWPRSIQEEITEAPQQAAHFLQKSDSNSFNEVCGNASEQFLNLFEKETATVEETVLIKDIANFNENKNLSECWIKEEQIYKDINVEDTGSTSFSQQDASASRNYSCDICSKMFQTSKKLKAHMFSEKHFFCIKCKKIVLRVFHRSVVYRAHMESAHSIKVPYHCTTCERSFPSYKDLIKHRQITHVLCCPICSKPSRTKQELEAHINARHTLEKPYKCQECEKSYSSYMTYRVHLKTHIVESFNRCDICKESYSPVRRLERHFNTHAKQFPLNCNTCGVSISDPCAYKKHRRTHFHISQFPCDTCEKTFSSLNRLKSHVLTLHTEEHRHKCNECGKAYTLSGLRRHVRDVHRDERPYKCRICEKSFKNTRHRALHESVHNYRPTCSSN